MDKTEVIWRKISLGPYEVSNDSRIRRSADCRSGKVGDPLKMYYSSNGTISANIFNYKGKCQHVQLSRLVAQAFDIPNPNNYRYIGYKDGNRRNCSPDNLEWVQHRNLNIDSRCGTAILCVESGEKYPSKYAVAKKFGVSTTYVRLCLTECRKLRGNTLVVLQEKGDK